MITFNNIVERFKIFAENHFFIETFSFGSPDDVDLAKFTSFPLMHLVYTGATYDPGTKTYNLEVYILDVPADKTKKVDRQKEVVSDAEQCAEDIIADIKNGGNIFLFAQDYEVVNATTTPLEEETKNVLSGVLLDLSVSIPYEWDACNAPIDGVEPGGTEVTYARRGILRMLTVDGATDVPSVRTIKVTNGTLTDDGDGVVTLDTGGVSRLSQLDDTAIVTPADREALIYDGGNWVNDNITKSDVGLGNVDNTSDDDKPVSSATQTALNAKANSADFSNVDNTSDADKPISTATQTALNAKADTSAVPTELNDLTDVTISGTPSANEALIFDTATSSFKSLPNFTNRFEDEAENNKPSTPFSERVYTVKADGDGIFIDAQSDTPSSGKKIERKIYHKAGFLESGDAIGDFTLIHTFADDTAYSATESVFEGFRDGDTYGTPPFTLLQTWEEVTAFTGLLDTYTGAKAAYSLRQLRTGETEAVRVRRSSDNAEQTIGFSANELDTTALTTFCGSSDGFVVSWMDQSGNGNDATQSTTANQPKIYDGTTGVVTENGKPAVEFDGSNDRFETSWNIGTTSSFTAFHTISPTNNNSRRYLYDLRDANDDGIRIILFEDGKHFFSVDSSDLRTTSYSAGHQLVFQNFASSTIGTGIDGATANTTSGPASTSATANAGLFSETAVAVRNYYLGKAQEVIFYLSDQSSNRTNIESNINTFYSIF